ncbi:PEP-CTERM sorting domain-containing protein [Nodularia sp. NIES-3585]|uniref:PEP-CTERM sorting domain-containing protein n=1 Tax=Nodularia sp. NIES-3585 TaxID=1973477 RepID=UPI000B6610AA|nr:PEP-CTERM sorting domain-containing protein [Nodularia sp. NIES-3585]GAX36096.1 hypothetical protein NIES3585_21210 [Nodularia sp. NIES-3585]
MITSKSNFFKGAVATLAALPLAAAATFTPAGSAQAASLVGSFSLTGDVTANLTLDALNFAAPKTFTIHSGLSSGTFAGFTSGTMSQVLSFDTDSFVNPFVTLNSADARNGSTFTGNTASYTLRQAAANLVAIEVTTSGIFTNIENGKESKGGGLLTLNTLGTVANIQNRLNSAQTVTTTFSGIQFATVPEPATLLGLGVVAAGMAVSRRRKSIPQ